MKNFKKNSLLMLLTLFVFTSCFKLEDTDFNTKDTATYFETEDDIASAVTVVYNSLAKGTQDELTTNSTFGGLYDGLTIILSASAHTGYDTRTFGGNKITSDNKDIKNLYVYSYFGISKANLVITKAKEIEMSEENRNKYIAEARFLRGLFYFNLVQYFGGVPIRVEDYDGSYEDSLLPRSSAEEVYDFIIEDFKFAETYLPLDDFDGGNHATGRASSSAASGLLAKVYLTMAGHPLNKGTSHYTLARDYAKKVMDLNIYQLLPDYGEIFHSTNKNNREWLFSVQFSDVANEQGHWGGWQNLQNNWDELSYGQWHDKGDGYGRVTLTQELVEAYNEEDPRAKFNIVRTKKKAKKGVPQIETKLWKLRTMKFRFSAPRGEARHQCAVNAPVLRYADILLTYAEAENEINGPTQASFDAINQVRARARAGIPFADIPASSEPADLFGLDQESLRENIFWERARELCLEGLDRFDLVRSGNYYTIKSNAVHVNQVGGVLDPEAHHDLLPIPIEAIRNNPKIENQNPGY